MINQSGPKGLIQYINCVMRAADDDWLGVVVIHKGEVCVWGGGLYNCTGALSARDFWHSPQHAHCVQLADGAGGINFWSCNISDYTTRNMKTLRIAIFLAHCLGKCL